jgi:hypothetical protein
MAKIRYAEGLKVLPILAPVALTTSAVTCAGVHMDVNQWATFLISFGVMTSDATDTVTVTVEASTSGSTAATSTAIAFKYRLSAAVATDTMGTITDATAAGVAVTATSDAMMLVVDVNPDALPAVGEDATWLHVTLTPSAEHGGSIISAVAVLEPRYPANLAPSST